MKVKGDLMDNELKIKDFLMNNYNYISTGDFLKLNISKPLIKKYIDSGLIRKVSHGLYIESGSIEDDLYILQRRYPNVIYSYNTALYLLNLLYKESDEISITVNSKKRVIGDYDIHYVSDKYYDIGIIEITNMMNNPIKIYNAERCICDMLKSNAFDLNLQNEVLDNYFKSKDKDINRLLEYSKIFNIHDKVNTLVEYAIR